jgi:hypothetical protein
MEQQLRSGPELLRQQEHVSLEIREILPSEEAENIPSPVSARVVAELRIHVCRKRVETSVHGLLKGPVFPMQSLVPALPDDVF